MNICWLIMTDGRDALLGQTIGSARRNLVGPITHKVIHTDNGDGHRRLLQTRYPDFEVIGGKRLGFGGAIARAWKYLSKGPYDFLFSIEDDFTFNRSVDLGAMARVLTDNPNIAQMALRRQPWNDRELEAGGVVELDPEAYTECTDGKDVWLEHRKFWTTNCSLIPISIVKRGWPVVLHSEGVFSIDLFRSRDVVCGYWGAKASEPWIHHIGKVRVGRNY